jgi:hypothetical protein
MDVVVVGDVVAVIASRRGVERQQPDGVDAEVLDVVEPLGKAAKVADAVLIAVVEGTDVDLVDDRILVLECIRRRRRPRDLRRCFRDGSSFDPSAHRCGVL